MLKLDKLDNAFNQALKLAIVSFVTVGLMGGFGYPRAYGKALNDVPLKDPSKNEKVEILKVKPTPASRPVDQYPAVATNIFFTTGGKKFTNNECINDSLRFLARVSDVRINGVTVFGFTNFDGKGYTIAVRCDEEHQVFFVSASGPDGEAADSIMDTITQFWSGSKNAN